MVATSVAARGLGEGVVMVMRGCQRGAREA
jgi:hypothetical protein